MSRRRIEDRNVRSLTKIAGGSSYAITLPIEVVRGFKWRNKQKLQIQVDEKKQRIIIEDWKG